MSWNLSTGFNDQFLDRDTAFGTVLNAATISFTGLNTIADSGNGLDVFAVDDWIYIIDGAASNLNIKAKVLTVSAAELTFEAASFTNETAEQTCIATLKGGSFKELMQNAALYLYSGTRPATADLVENGTLLAKLTADGNTFAFNTSLNGLNFGNLTDSILGIGDDPATGITEVWSGDGLVAGTATWGRLHANDGNTEASVLEVRMDGNITTVTGGDLVMPSRDIVVGVPAVLSEMNVGIFSTPFTS